MFIHCCVFCFIHVEALTSSKDGTILEYVK